MNTRLYTFVGGTTEPWQVASMQTITGEPLASFEKLDIVNGPLIADLRSSVGNSASSPATNALSCKPRKGPSLQNSRVWAVLKPSARHSYRYEKKCLAKP